MHAKLTLYHHTTLHIPQETVPPWRKFLGALDALYVAARALVQQRAQHHAPQQPTAGGHVHQHMTHQHTTSSLQHTTSSAPPQFISLTQFLSETHHGNDAGNSNTHGGGTQSHAAVGTKHRSGGCATMLVCWCMQPWVTLTTMWMHYSQFVWYGV